MKNYWTIFTNGLVKENPLLVLMIGLCSSLAVTTSFSNGLGMGLAMTFVLLMSEIISWFAPGSNLIHGPEILYAGFNPENSA